MEGLTLSVAALAAYRVTRLITADRIALPLRRWVDRRFGDDSSLGYFVRCPWCVGWYVSGVTVLAVDSVESVPVPLLAVLAMSTVVGLLAELAG